MLEVDISDVQRQFFWTQGMHDPWWDFIFNPVEQMEETIELVRSIGNENSWYSWYPMKEEVSKPEHSNWVSASIHLHRTVRVSISPSPKHLPTVSKISTRMMSACAIPGVQHSNRHTTWWHSYSLNEWTLSNSHSLPQNSWDSLCLHPSLQIPPVSSHVTGTHRQTTFDFISHRPGCSGPGAGTQEISLAKVAEKFG